jgi:hypothetical protein
MAIFGVFYYGKTIGIPNITNGFPYKSREFRDFLRKWQVTCKVWSITRTNSMPDSHQPFTSALKRLATP